LKSWNNFGAFEGERLAFPTTLSDDRTATCDFWSQGC
jgi:hypothetical protein